MSCFWVSPGRKGLLKSQGPNQTPTHKGELARKFGTRDHSCDENFSFHYHNMKVRPLGPLGGFDEIRISELCKVPRQRTGVSSKASRKAKQ